MSWENFLLDAYLLDTVLSITNLYNIAQEHRFLGEVSRSMEWPGSRCFKISRAPSRVAGQE